MSEAPEDCANCPLFDEMDDCGYIDWDMERDPVAVPGSDCPFVQLDAANEEIERLRQVVANAYHEGFNNGLSEASRPRSGRTWINSFAFQALGGDHGG